MTRRPGRASNEGATLGYEEKLWRAAEGLRGHIEPAEYKHIVLGLVFLKYVSDNAEVTSVSGRRARGVAAGGRARKARKTPTSFKVPVEARWSEIVAGASRGSPSQAIESATAALRSANPSLDGLLEFGLRRIGGDQLARLIEVLGGVSLDEGSNGARDVFGRVYEYFLAKFASAEGRSGGEYYTPRSVVRLLVEMLQPFKGTVYDPCCGTAGMFVQSERFVEEHGGSRGDVEVFGQESSPTTWRLARLNLALRGIRANLGAHHADSFMDDLHSLLKADFILANPPFNLKDWGAQKLAKDPRWKFGIPPSANANYAWIQHIFSHLSETGVAGFVMSNGSLSSDQGGEGDLRRALVEADVIDCIVSLPSQLFYGTQIPACLWFISPTKTRGRAVGLRGQTLFVDARHLGQLVDRTHRQLTHDDIAAISDAYHRWRQQDAPFERIRGFAYSASIADIRRHKYALVPGRYVGFPDVSLHIDGLSSLGPELREVRTRLREASAASRSALTLIESLSNG